MALQLFAFESLRALTTAWFCTSSHTGKHKPPAAPFPG